MIASGAVRSNLIVRTNFLSVTRKLSPCPCLPSAPRRFLAGTAQQYIKDNKLCESCTRKDGLCVLYWNGETFSRDGMGATLSGESG